MEEKNGSITEEEFDEIFEEDDSDDIFKLNDEFDEYTEGQTSFLHEIKEFLDSDDESGVYVLAGYAGTGKTGLIANVIGYASSAKRMGAAVLGPTHKSLQVIRHRLNIRSSSVSTIHSALYGAPDEDGFFSIGYPKPLTDLAKVCVFDESSMIPDDILADILKAGKRVKLVFIGDSFQLPPVGSDHDLLWNANITLDEVKRHDSEILNLATRVRERKKIILPSNKLKYIRTYNDMEINRFVDEYKRTDDAVLVCATNRRRVHINHSVRNFLGRSSDLVVPGESLISISNNDNMVNGESFRVEKVDSISGPFKAKLDQHNFKGGAEEIYYKVVLLFGDEDNEKELLVYLFPRTLRPSIYNAQLDELKYRDDNGRLRVDTSVVIATYAYGISCHKSQGSQWKSVFVNQDYIVKGNTGPRWYYTAVTRATERLFICENPYIRGRKRWANS